VLDGITWKEFLNYIKYIDILEAEQDYRLLNVVDNHLFLKGKNTQNYSKLPNRLLKIINSVRKTIKNPEIEKQKLKDLFKRGGI